MPPASPADNFFRDRMNPKIASALVGVFSLLIGLTALLFTDFAMAHLLGFAVAPSWAATTVHGEVRAVYGGILIVAGIVTLLASSDPPAARERLLLLGLLWLGACAARLYSAFVEGNPGIFGWLSVVIELAMGSVLIVSAQRRSADSPFSSAAQPPA